MPVMGIGDAIYGTEYETPFNYSNQKSPNDTRGAFHTIKIQHPWQDALPPQKNAGGRNAGMPAWFHRWPTRPNPFFLAFGIDALVISDAGRRNGGFHWFLSLSISSAHADFTGMARWTIS